MLRLQALKRGDHLILVHADRIGDHPRGLFEAEASVVMSAAHALENIKILLF